MSEKTNYKQILTPDYSRIAEIILSAKGVERTMLQFSEASGINTSTLSRLSNGRMKRPLTIDVINAIMDNKSRSCEFSKDDLFRANGMMDEKTYEHRYHNERPHEKMRIQQERLMSMKTIIVNELYGRGVGFRKLTRDETDDISSIDRSTTIKTGLLLKMLETENEPFWCLLFNTAKLDPDDRETIIGMHNDTLIESLQQRMIAYYASIFLQDAWEPESLSGLKCSFVFCDETVYNAFRERLANARISSNMSSVLLDLDSRKVIREEPLPGCNKPDQDHYFDISLVEDNTGFFEDDFSFDAFDE